LAIKMPNFC